MVVINPVIKLTEKALRKEKSTPFCSLYTLITSNKPKAVMIKLKRLKMGFVCKLKIESVKKYKIKHTQIPIANLRGKIKFFIRI